MRFQQFVDERDLRFLMWLLCIQGPLTYLSVEICQVVIFLRAAVILECVSFCSVAWSTDRCTEHLAAWISVALIWRDLVYYSGNRVGVMLSFSAHFLRFLNDSRLRLLSGSLSCIFIPHFFSSSHKTHNLVS